jgi:Mrp family chromosome partitioning ATPase
MIMSSATHAKSETPRGGAAIGNAVQRHYRMLLQRLDWPGDKCASQLRTLGVTSSRQGEGVSTVAAHLAAAAAGLSDPPVLLVDANFVQLSPQREYSLDLQPGLADVLGGAPAAKHLRASSVANLYILAAGKASAMPAASCDPEVLAGAVKRLGEDHALVVFDMPAAGESTWALRLAGLLDGVLLVIESRRVRREVVRRTVELLSRANAQLLGAVLNKHSLKDGMEL